MNEKIVHVQMLGGFVITCGGMTVDCGGSRSRKCKSLLAYLLCNRNRMVPIEELLRILESDEKDGDPTHALRMLLSRVRRMLDPVEEQMGIPLIVNQNGRYGWNRAAGVWVDADEFEMMCRATAWNDLAKQSWTTASDEPAKQRRATASDKSAKESRTSSSDDPAEWCRKLLELYHGDFLDVLAGETWVELQAEYYRNVYLQMAERTVPVLMENKFFREAADLCRVGIHISPYSEVLYCWLMRTLAAQGNPSEAIAAYEKLRTFLSKDLGIQPSDEVRQVYQDIVRESGERVISLDDIRKQLQEYDTRPGAYVCDFASFKLIYQSEARAALRRGDAIHIGVLTVRGRGNGRIAPNSLKIAMQQLDAQISQNLRMGDIASCVSPSQYVLMLLQANYENSKMVCDRVAQSFLRAHPASPARIHSVVFPLEPAFTALERDSAKCEKRE